MYFSIEALYSKNITDLSRFINESILEIKIKEGKDIEDLLTIIDETIMEIKLKEDKQKHDFKTLNNDISTITVDCQSEEQFQYQVNSTNMKLHFPSHCHLDLKLKNITDLIRFIDNSIISFFVLSKFATSEGGDKHIKEQITKAMFF